MMVQPGICASLEDDEEAIVDDEEEAVLVPKLDIVIRVLVLFESREMGIMFKRV